jgi:hypothetical protein
MTDTPAPVDQVEASMQWALEHGYKHGDAHVLAQEVTRLRLALTASEQRLELANKLWRLCVKDGWPWADGATQDALNALGLLYPKDMTEEDSGPECTNCEGDCETCWRAVGKLEDVK